MAQTGRGEMGSHKHGTSGRIPRSPGYKMQRTREANELAEAEKAKRLTSPMYPTIADAMKARR